MAGRQRQHIPLDLHTEVQPGCGPDVADVRHSQYRYVKKSRRIGCVNPRCYFQRGITQPILRLFLTYNLYNTTDTAHTCYTVCSDRSVLVLHCAFCRLPLICKIGPQIREGRGERGERGHLGNAAKRVHYVCLASFTRGGTWASLSRLSHAVISGSLSLLCTVSSLSHAKWSPLFS